MWTPGEGACQAEGTATERPSGGSVEDHCRNGEREEWKKIRSDKQVKVNRGQAQGRGKAKAWRRGKGSLWNREADRQAGR